MTDDKDKTLYLIIGVVVGALIIYFSRKSTTQTQQLYNGNFNEDFYNNFNRKIDNFQLKMNELSSKIEKLQSINIQPQQQTQYKNSEKTNFILNEEGDIIGMETTRDAKIGK